MNESTEEKKWHTHNNFVWSVKILQKWSLKIFEAKDGDRRKKEKFLFV